MRSQRQLHLGGLLCNAPNRCQARRAVLTPLFGARWFLLPHPPHGSLEHAISDPACTGRESAADWVNAHVFCSGYNVEGELVISTSNFCLNHPSHVRIAD